MTLGTNMPSYSGNEPIIITGAISPTPGANTGVVITTRNPGGNIVDTGVTNPSSVGSFNYTLVPGGPAWTAGTFSVNATWGGSGGTASRVVTFKYSPAVSTTYTMTLQTNAASYNGTEPIVITGLISPAPGPNTAVVITVTNPKVSVVDIGEAPVSSSTGSFNYTLVSGGNAAWISGTFSVNATWSGDGAIASRLVTFVYSRTTTSSTTSTSTSTRTSNTTSSTTTSPTTSSTASALVQNVTTKWDPFTDFYNFLNHGLFNDGGDCYGSSSTAILYFRHYQLGDQTYPYYPQPTSSVSAMKGQTGKYCLGQLGCLEQEDVLSQSTFPLYIHQTYGQEQSVLYGNETTQAQLMMQSIQNGIPVILGLGPTDGHAVIAFDYQQFSNGNLVIGISDPNYGNTPRYAYYANGQFSYVGTYSWTTFEVISPEMLQWAWLSPYQLSGTVNQTNAYYTYVFSTAPITIVSGSGRASFSLSGDSLSFSNSISGVVGFEERGIQAYAIPKGVSYTVLDPGTTSSNVLVIIPQNQTSIVGYQLTSTSAKPLNVTISPTLANLNVTAASAMNLSVSLFSVGGQSQSIINATSLPIAPSQTAVFSVPNWGNLNSTQSGANLEVFQANKTAPIATYTLAKGQQNLSPTSSAFPLSSSALATAAVVIVALLAYVGIRRRGQPTPMKNAGPVPK